MNKKEEQEEVSYPIVKPPRTKKDPYAVELLLDPSGGHGEETAAIKFSIRISRESAQKLHDYIIEDPEVFAHDFLSNLSAIPLEEIMPERKVFIEKLKSISGWLYAFFRYWCKIPQSSWPKYLVLLVETAIKEEFEGYIMNSRGKYSAQGLAAYTIAKCFSKELEKYGLDPIGDEDNFYITYINDKNRPRTVTRAFIRGRTSQEIANLAYRPPLKRVFRELKFI